MIRRAALAAAATGWLLAAGPAATQDATPLLEALSPTDEGPTALEQYLDERDRLIVERIHRQPPLSIGGGASLQLEAIVAFEPARLQERMLGIRIRAIGTSLTGPAAILYLDLREVEELVRAIDLMDELLANETGDTEIRHVSRDGFGVVAIRSGDRRTFSVRLHGAEDEAPLELPIGEAGLASLRGQLEDSRLHLFAQ